MSVLTATTATMGTTATAVSFTYPQAMTAHAFMTWSSPATTHTNKRFSRRPRGGSIT